MDIEELRALLAEVDPAFLEVWCESGVPHCKAPEWTPESHACRHPANFGEEGEAELACAAVNALPALLDVAEAAGTHMANEKAWQSGKMLGVKEVYASERALVAALARLKEA